MAALYADENFDAGIVAELRRLGHDVRTVQEAGRCGFDNPTVRADATAEGRAVLTFNRRDFVKLHLQANVHAGIIACTHDTAGPVVGQCLRVTKPPPRSKMP